MTALGVALAVLIVATVLFHLMFLRWLRVGKRFWLLAEYFVCGVGLIGVFASVAAMVIQANSNAWSTRLESLKSQIDEVQQRLRSDKIEGCASRGDGEEDSNTCFASTTALTIFELWHMNSDYPFSGIPSCEDIKQNIQAHSPPGADGEEYEAQWVKRHIGIKVVHPTCLSSDRSKRIGSLGYSAPADQPESIAWNVLRIADFMPCFYQDCQVSVFQTYDADLKRIDQELTELRQVRFDIKSREHYVKSIQWLGYALVAIAFALRITRTTAELLSHKWLASRS